MALLALAHGGDEVVVQRNAHSSTIDALVLVGPAARRSSRPSSTRSCCIAHCVTPEALDRALEQTPRARSAPPSSRPPTSAPWPTCAALAEVAHAHGVPLVVDEAWGAHLAFHADLPEHALAAVARTS